MDGLSSIEWAYQRFKIDENVITAHFIITSSVSEFASERRSDKICVVVERPDHHCGDDLVSLKAPDFFGSLSSLFRHSNSRSSPQWRSGRSTTPNDVVNLWWPICDHWVWGAWESGISSFGSPPMYSY